MSSLCGSAARSQGAPARTRKARGHGGERREEILDHAQRLFAAHGVHSVSTRQIAEAVGISQPSLYAHFPRRADILQEVSARAFRKIGLLSPSPDVVDGDPMKAMILAYIAFGLAEPDAYRIAFMIEGLHDEEDGLADSEMSLEAERAFGLLRSVVAERLGRDHADVEVASQSLWASMHGLVALLLARGGFPWVEQRRLIDWHVDALARAVDAPGQS